MAISTPSVLDTQVSTSTVASLTSASIAPSANALLIVVASIRRQATIPHIDSVTDTFSDVGAWTIYGPAENYNATPDLSGGIAIAVAQAGASPGTGAVTVGWSVTTSARSILRVFEVTGHNTATPVAQSKTNTGILTTLTITLDSTPAADSMVFAAINSVDASGVTNDADFTEIAETSSGGTNDSYQQEQYDLASASTGVDWSDLNTDTNVAVAIEIKAAASGTTRNLVATLTGVSSASGASSLERLMASLATLTGVTSTPGTVMLDTAGLRALSATLTALSAAGTATLDLLRNWAATFTAESSTGVAILELRLTRTVTFTAVSATSGATGLDLVRNWVATLTAESGTADTVQLTTEQLLALAATLTAQSDTTDTVALAILRNWAVTLTAESAAAGAVIFDTAGLVALLATLTAESAAGLVSLEQQRAIAAALTAESATAAASLDILRNLAAGLTAQSGSADTVTLDLLRNLSATLTAESRTEAADLVVLWLFAAALTAVTQTNGSVSLDMSVFGLPRGIVSAAVSGRAPGATANSRKAGGTFTSRKPGTDWSN